MAPSPTDYAIVLTTASSEEEASVLANGLVERRLAACVNVLGAMKSVYRWKGEICREEERLLVIKTSASLFPEIRSAIRTLHSYETPEIVMICLDDADPSYLAWLAECVGEGKRGTG